MADDIIIPEEKQDVYVSPFEDVLREEQQNLDQQQKDDEERIKQLTKGRAYWAGANMFANALSNLINVYGTTHGAPAMKMPDMDNGYMKQWKESDNLRKANYLRMKDKFDKLRLAKIQDESRHNDILEGRTYAENKRNKEIRAAANSYKSQWNTMFPGITDEQYIAWAQFGDSHMPLAIKQHIDEEADERKLNLDRQQFGQRADAQKRLSEAETKRIAQQYKAAYAEWNITEAEAEALANKIVPPRIAKLAAENNVSLQNFGSKRGTVSFGGTKKGEEHNIYIGDYVIQGSNKNQYSSNLGKLKSAVLKAIQRTEYYKGLREYVDKERDEYTHAKAMKWSDDDLSQYIDYFNLLNDPEFVNTIKSMAGVEAGQEENQGGFQL